MRTPEVPGTPTPEERGIEVFEWLDRPIEAAVPGPLCGWRLPIVLASVFIGRNSLRLSSPRAANLDRIADVLFTRLEGGPQSIRREAAPLSLPFLDADVWIFRMPPGVDPDRSEELARGDRALFRERVDSSAAEEPGQPVAAWGIERSQGGRQKRAGQADGGCEAARTARGPLEHESALQGLSVRPLAEAARSGLRAGRGG